MHDEILLRHTQPDSQKNVTFSKISENGVKTHLTKARAGRGRKISKWVSFLLPTVVVEFNRLSEASVRFDCRVLRKLLFDVTSKGTKQDSSSNNVDEKCGLSIKEHIKSE